jgi:hypothetical protein
MLYETQESVKVLDLQILQGHKILFLVGKQDIQILQEIAIQVVVLVL